MKNRNIFKECRETVEQIGKANGKEGKAATTKLHTVAMELLGMTAHRCW